ncbi:MAG: cytochrome c [Rhodobacteraceae bacterium]|nr:cytochrome c [Paracoccaceae bacterium]
MHRLIVPLALIGMIGVFGHAAVAWSADEEWGREFAQRVCAECHAVLPQETFSPNPAAPTFAAIAENPSMSRIALVVWFQTPHPKMPNLVLKAEDQEGIIAYILSLADEN